MPKVIRPIRIEGNLAFVPLTQGHEAIIDAADVHLVEGRNWYVQVDGCTFYAITSVTRDDGRQDAVRMHRIIAETPSGFETDHKNGNGLDNRKSNLRTATHAENMRNYAIPAHNSSGFKGVSWCKVTSRWMAYIKVSGVQKNLGRFDTKEEAHAAYVKASALHHGEFGRVA